MRKIIIIVGLFILTSGIIGYAKDPPMRVDINNIDILVMVAGDPKPWIGGKEAAFVQRNRALVGLIAGVHPLIEGKKLRPVIEGFPFHSKIRDGVIMELSKNVKGKIIPVCLMGEAPGTKGCVVVNDPKVLKSEHAGKLILGINLAQVGILEKQPFITLRFAVFDAGKLKPVSEKYLLFLERPSRIPAGLGERTADEWIAKKADLLKCYDYHITLFAKGIPSCLAKGIFNPNLKYLENQFFNLKYFFKRGEATKEDPVVYIG